MTRKALDYQLRYLRSQLRIKLAEDDLKPKDRRRIREFLEMREPDQIQQYLDYLREHGLDAEVEAA